ncbi:MAG: PepSY domain-containing protein [Acetobacteraceae bacterium]|nr:PepSY domain-containing protein [Acetobacteraceae bacterium]
MKARTIRAWSWLHAWSSLVCTGFLLLMCLTGLPLVFHHEIDHLIGAAAEPPSMPPGTPRSTLDAVVAAARAHRPSDVVQYIGWEADEPDALMVIMAATPGTEPNSSHTLFFDARTTQVLEAPGANAGLTLFLLRLHVDMFAGLPGKLLLGFMGLLFLLAVVSGVVLYGPFMRRLNFGTVRLDRGRRVRWLDLHNLLGIATLVWALVVGATGVINAAADLLIEAWRTDQLAAMVAPYRNQPPVMTPGSVDRALAAAQAAAPGMTPGFIAFPGTRFSSEHHYAVFMRGKTPLTARLLKPVLVDAATLEVTEARDLPWYLTGLLASQPLHFGDYGGLPLKVIWALLDIATIVVLGSGLYLWLVRRWAPARASHASPARSRQARGRRGAA